jgi:alpha-ketoglutarate-dependent taurine dioxygenase
MSGDSSGPSSARRHLPYPSNTVKPVAINFSNEEFCRFGLLAPGRELPLVVEPNFRNVDLMGWVRNNRDLLQTKLIKHGGILFRGFGLRTQTHFEQFIRAFAVELMHYMEGATPRTELGDKVYTSTEFPPERSISIHNELCYVATWPMKIMFYCVKPPCSGGETPIGDVRKVLQRIKPEIRSRFRDKGWMLLRNFGNGFGLTWQTSFHVSDKSALETYFDAARISYEWIGRDRLRTRQVRPAIAAHPKTGELVWFNHIGFWHVSSLEPGLRARLLEDFTEEGLPFNTYYGDGTPIEDWVIDHLRDAYDAETVTFPWRQGDLLLLDNMLVAHGRRPFTGTRVVLTAMGEPLAGGNSQN